MKFCCEKATCGKKATFRHPRHRPTQKAPSGRLRLRPSSDPSADPPHRARLTVQPTARWVGKVYDSIGLNTSRTHHANNTPVQHYLTQRNGRYGTCQSTSGRVRVGK